MITKAKITSLIEESKSFLMSYALKRSNHIFEDAEDLYQETVYRLLTKGEYDTDKGKFRTYAARVMTNLQIDRYRKRQCRPSNTMSIDWFRNDEGEDLPLDFLVGQSDNDGESSLDIEFIMEKINELPDRLKKPLLMRIEGYSFDEISKKTNIKSSTLRPSILRARDILKEKLSEEIIFRDKSKMAA